MRPPQPRPVGGAVGDAEASRPFASEPGLLHVQSPAVHPDQVGCRASNVHNDTLAVGYPVLKDAAVDLANTPQEVQALFRLGTLPGCAADVGLCASC
jgi:hypothetical protein